MGDKIGHAEIKIGDSYVMLADEFPEHGAILAPRRAAARPVSLMIYVDDVDSAFQQGDRRGRNRDAWRSRTSSGAIGWDR